MVRIDLRDLRVTDRLRFGAERREGPHHLADRGQGLVLAPCVVGPEPGA
ncbi:MULTISPECIES: hypothetical protein [unclassified Variovorax]|nr:MULTISPECIES: hypothetical protein [unclassified Variovorax]MDM0091433.1 hypothetical protein [Variovorax sp. J22G40]MDM0149631.1 hypothetical protein [Variovorax sp. J2P1-31]